MSCSKVVKIINLYSPPKRTHFLPFAWHSSRSANSPFDSISPRRKTPANFPSYSSVCDRHRPMQSNNPNCPCATTPHDCGTTIKSCSNWTLAECHALPSPQIDSCPSFESTDNFPVYFWNITTINNNKNASRQSNYLLKNKHLEIERIRKTTGRYDRYLPYGRISRDRRQNIFTNWSEKCV